MSKRYQFAVLITVIVLIVVGASGLFAVVQSTDATPPPLPTLAQLDVRSDDIFVEPNQAIQDAVIEVERSPVDEEFARVETNISEVELPTPDQVVLEFADDMSADDILAYVETLDVEVVDTITELNRVVILADDDIAETILLSEIVSSEPDYYAQAFITVPPGDPYYYLQSNLTMIDAPSAWALLIDTIPTIRVAVIDSGMCFEHPDMQGDYSDFQWDYVEDDETPQDDYGHGCSVAGTIASQNNTIGGIGVAPFVELMPLRTLNEDGLGTYSDIAQAIIDATNNDADIINMSLGGYNESSLLQSAVDYALENDVYLVAATGNDGNATSAYPARFDGVIAVGSVNEHGDISSFSNRGEDTLAPGESIVVPYLNNSYVFQTGTSFSAPHVSGVIALELALGRTPVITDGIIQVQSSPEPTPTPTDIPSTERTSPFASTEQVPPQLTDRWVVRLVEGADADAVAQSLGYVNLGQVGSLDSYYVFVVEGTATSEAQAQSTAIILASSSQVLEFNQEVARMRDERVLPGDPLTTDQWHLYNTGQTSGTAGEDINVMSVWDDGITGNGVNIVIVDDALQHTHPDIATHYNATGSFDYNSSDPNSTLDTDNDPAPEDGDDSHGTSVGGVAAADDDGTACGVGVAYDASLSGIRLISDPTVTSQEAAALTYQMQVNDIYNNSWGPNDQFGNSYGYLEPLHISALEDGVTNGRDGKGVIYIFASGNGLLVDDNSNYDGFSNSPYTISVGATDHNGRLARTLVFDASSNLVPAFYSEGGANVFINAPSGNLPGIVTSDLLGSDGANNNSGYSDDCTDSFGGTSSAAPTVAGVIALMLETNPSLTWRDVQYILAETAEKNDPTDPSWQTNKAGYDTNYYYGFGRVDAEAAVALAKTWTGVSPQIVTGPHSATSNAPLAIPDGAGTWSSNFSTFPEFTTPATKSLSDTFERIQFIETVEVEIDLSHSYIGDLAFVLESPEGTLSTLALPRRFDNANGSITLKMSSKDFWGETACCDWKLHVYDGYSGSTGTFFDWRLKVYGTRGTYYVNYTEDDIETCTAEQCSLAEAVQHARQYTEETGNEGVVIIPPGTYNLFSRLVIMEKIHIIGAGSDQTIIDAQSRFRRAFDIYAPATIENLAITGGDVWTGDGGGIRVNGNRSSSFGDVTLNAIRIYGNRVRNGGNGGGIAQVQSSDPSLKVVLSNSVIEGNSAEYGGGIYIGGDAGMEISETLIRDNFAGGFGGGIYSDVLTFNFVYLSTIAENRSLDGGGYYLDNAATGWLFNTTISGNRAVRWGGGVFFDDNAGAPIWNTTITNNRADFSSIAAGGGIYYNVANENYVFDIVDSIIAGNTDDTGTGPDCYSGSIHVKSYSRNIFGDTTGCLIEQYALGLYHPYDLINVDPLLDPLADNGGYTPTHALQANSPAIDRHIEQSCRDVLRRDQRGIHRDVDMVCDIGAFEYDPTAIFPAPPQVIAVDTVYADPPISQHPGFTTTWNAIYNNYVANENDKHAISLRFNKSLRDERGNMAVTDATNPLNYRVVTAGTNDIFDTVTCGDILGDDVEVTIDSIWHTQAYQTVYLNLNGALPLAPGSYRVIACNLVTQDDVPMASDFVYDFMIGNTLQAQMAILTAISAPVRSLEEVHEYDTIHNSLFTHFNQDVANPAGDSDPNDVTNLNNYRLLTPGADNIFQTTSCNVQGDDQLIGIDSVTYYSSLQRADLTLSQSLIDGRFRFAVCDEIQKPSSESLDGDMNGVPGGDYISEFIFFPRPTDVTAVQVLDKVTVEWTDLAVSETGYVVERRVNQLGNGWAEVGSTGVNTTSFDDYTVECGVDYVYRVQTRRDTDKVRSGYSDEVTISIDCTGLFIVNSTSDTNDGVCDIASCSLREAIIVANAYGDGAIVSIPSGTYNLSIAGTGEDASATGDLDITANIHVVGAGRDQTIIDANNIDRVFDVLSPPLSVTGTQIEGVTITGGQTVNNENGGGIRLLADGDGLLRIINSRITANISSGNGGGIASEYVIAPLGFEGSGLGIYNTVIESNMAVNGGGLFTNFGFFTITDSSIEFNQASNDGGGIYASEYGGGMTAHSVLHHNSANRGGGGYYVGFPNDDLSKPDVFAMFENSTISNNSALTDGGGIVTQNQVRSVLRFTTVAENIADSDNNDDGDGGGLFFDDVNAVDVNSFSNMILYDNVDLSGQANDCASEPLVTISQLWTNIVPEMSDCFVGGTQTTYIGVDPLLGDLADNGGPTLTHAIPANNVGIDTGFFQHFGSYYHLTDQRGQYHNPWGKIDAGSFDYSVEPLNILPELVDIYLGTATHETYINNPILGTYQSVNTRVDNIRTLTIYFDEQLDNPFGHTASYDVTNPNNYMLVADGPDQTFNTTSCDAINGDDVGIGLNSLTLSSNNHGTYSVDPVEYQPYVRRVILALEIELPHDEYRLIVCNLRDLEGNPLDGNGDGVGGDVANYDFVVRPRLYTLIRSDAFHSPFNEINNQFMALANDPMTSLSIDYTYSEGNIYDPNGDANPEDVTNPNNYMLIASGANQTIETTTCGVPVGDDIEIATDLVQSSNTDYDLNLTESLSEGLHRLLVCNIRAQDGTQYDGDWDYHAGGDFVGDFDVFLRPTNLTGTSSLGTIDITWDDNTLSESKFVIERRTPDTGWFIAGETATDVNRFTDDDLVCGEDYIYRVYGFRELDTTHSGYSNEVVVSADCTGLFIVNSTSDTNDGVCDIASCSLREAIIAANAYGDGAIVSIPSGTYNLSIAGTGEDASATGDLDITANIHVVGAGHDQTIIDANNIDRVFDIFSKSKVEYLTIQGGQPESGSSGGGIRISDDIVAPSFGDVELNDIRIRNNLAVNGDGGGVALVDSNGFDLFISYSIIENNSATNGGGISIVSPNVAGFTISETEIRNNQASLYGGGIYSNIATSTINYLVLSTIAENTAQSGGGIYFDNMSSSWLFTSTVSGNMATESGGGLYIDDMSSIPIYNSTVTNNIADSDFSSTGSGGGLFYNLTDDIYVFEIVESIIAGNIDNTGTAPDCHSGNIYLKSNSRNIFGDTTGCLIKQYTYGLYNQYDFINVDPLLESLANNGGYTRTHDLQADSPAIDKHVQQTCRAVPYHDQRGIPRQLSMTCDVGAVEHSPTSIFPIPLEVISVGTFNNSGTTITENPEFSSLWGGIYNNYVEGARGFSLRFNKSLKDPVKNTDNIDPLNPANYLLIGDGVNSTFDTLTCGEVQGDDIAITINSIWHAQANKAIYMSVNDVVVLPEDSYRLIACNLVAQDDMPMANDFIYDFVVADAFTLNAALPNNAISGTTSTLEEIHEYDIIQYEVQVRFNRDAADPAGDSAINDVTNVGNYRLVTAGTDGIFQTSNCTVAGDDVSVPISSVDYSGGDDIDWAIVNVGPSIRDDTYRFAVCDEVEDTLGQPIDGNKDGLPGGDYITEFIVFLKPTNVTATNISSELTISWDDNALSETGYVIERRINQLANGWAEIGSVGADEISYVDNNVVCNTEYVYRIQTRRDTDMMRSGYSDEVVVNVVCAPMVDPDNLVATPISGTRINLAWNDNNGVETAYKVERRESGGVFAEIADLPAQSTAFVDTNVVCDVIYEYRVRAYRSYDDSYSGYSNVASARALCPLVAPSGLTISMVIGQEQLDLDWVDNSLSETEFRIERSPAGADTWTQIAIVGADSITYLDTYATLGCYTPYDYRVIAFRADDSSVSDPSNVATGTTSCTIVYAPTNLTGTVNENSITLDWVDASPDEDNFEIQRADAGQNNWATLFTVLANVTTYTDTTTACGSEYDYRVFAQRGAVDSDFSNVLTIQQVCPPPPAPSDLSLIALPFSNDIQLDWTDNSLSETTFTIERSPDGVNGWTEIDSVLENIVTYTDMDAGLACYTDYHYRVRAHRSDDNVYSDYSNVSNVTTWCDPDNSIAGQVTTAFTVNQSTSDISGVVGFPQPSCAPGMAHAYVWEFPSIYPNLTLTLNTFGSSFDTVMSVWQFDGTTYTEVACNDDATFDGTSSVAGIFPSGTRHMVIVGGKNGASGNITLNSDFIATPTFTPPPTNTPVPTQTETPNLTTIGLFLEGMWLFRDANQTGSADIVVRFGAGLGDGWLPLVGDWNGDGIDGFGLYHKGRWFLRDVVGQGSANDYQFVFGFLDESWQPIVGDWDGDGADGIGLYKDGMWMLKNSLSNGDADYVFRFNPTTDPDAVAITGDWHDESADRVGLYADGVWFLSYANQTQNDAKIFQYGPNDGTWQPVVGDWDKDGDDTIGVYKDGAWRFRNSNSRGNADFGMTFGLNGGIPIAGYRGDGGALSLFASVPDTFNDNNEPTDIPTSVPTADNVEPTATVIPSLTPTPTLEPTFTPTATETMLPTETAIPTQTPTYTPTPEPPEIPDNTSGT